jgi:hypothetical protein
MRGARPEYGEPSARTVDATDIGSQHPARYGQNDCEIALGRKNYLFAGSDAGGARAAAAYTLIETAKLNGLDPEAYLHEVIAQSIASPNCCPGTSSGAGRFASPPDRATPKP